MQHAMVTTNLNLPGFRVLRSHGVVRGITVRSRSIIGNFLGASSPSLAATSPSTPSSASRPAPRPTS